MSVGKRERPTVSATQSTREPVLGAGAALSAVACLAAAMLAGGSTGLLAHPLRHALTLLALGAAVLSSWPVGRRLVRLGVVLGAVAGALILTASSQAPVNVLAAGFVPAVLAIGRSGTGATPEDGVHVRALTVTAAAGAILGAYRLAVTSVPVLWHGADALGGALGRLAGWITGQPLSVGPTFGGIDFLVLMTGLLVCRLAATPKPRLGRAVYAAAGVVSAHMIYLCVLSLCPAFLRTVPPVKPDDPWSWAGVLRAGVPWNVPAVGAALHLTVAWCMLRWPPWASAVRDAQPTAGGPRFSRLTKAHLLAMAPSLAAVVLACLVPVVTSLCPGTPDLAGKKVVLYKEGFLNWLRPQHGEYGRLSIGMYGMFQPFVESLGGRCVISPELSEQDLADADVLMLIFPDKPWAPGQLDPNKPLAPSQLERIWDFVRRGGSLWVLGEHTTREEGGGARFNDVLAPTGMEVAFDSATFEVGGWLHSYEPLAHAATAGIRDDRNQFGVVIGASVLARWPARPVLLGKWGWSDWGDEGSPRAMMGDHAYNPGERLGDIVLAAEQPFGRGRIVAFGDTSSVQNGIMIGSHRFVSRLLRYLAGKGSSVQDLWRGILGLILTGALAAVLVWRASAARVLAAVLVLSASAAACLAVSERRGEALPDENRRGPTRLAYLDNSHLGAHSEEGLRDDGLMGLELTLMRNGYLVFSMPEFSEERLKRADLFISVAPGRPFSRSERRAVREFVQAGGVFILSAGWDDRHGSESILKEFGFRIGSADPAAEPRPMGHFKSPYVRTESYMAHVRFHAGWPVHCDDPNARVVAYGLDASAPPPAAPENLPVIIKLKVGAGWVVVVGDTGFAMNKNLERLDGRPIEGMRENADFWRWFLPTVTDMPEWLPTAPASRPTTTPASAEAEDDA